MLPTVDANQSHSSTLYEQRTFPNMSDSHSFIIPLVSYTVYSVLNTVFGSFLTSIFSVFGILSNIINLIVYYKTGLQETTTIDFFVLAISDLVVSLSTIIIQVSRLVFTKSIPQTSWVSTIFMYPACGFSAMITALLSTERCLCVVFPLKVSIAIFREYLKQSLTSRRLIVTYPATCFTIFHLALMTCKTCYI